MKALVKACMSMSVPVIRGQRAVATMVSAYTYRKLSRIGLDQSQYNKREWNRIEEERRGPLLKLHGDQQQISSKTFRFLDIYSQAFTAGPAVPAKAMQTFS